MPSLFTKPTRTGRSRVARKASRSSRHCCESLESRLLLASWTTFTAPFNVSNMMLLSDGTVMAHGAGQSAAWYQLTPGQPGNVQGVDQSYIKGSWGALPSESVARQFFPSAVLPNGNVFVLGGEFASDITPPNQVSGSAEIYNPITNAWIPGIAPFAQDSVGNRPVNQFGDDPIEVLPDGRVLVGYIFGPQTYIYDPKTNAWSAGPTKVHADDNSDEETWVKLADGSILTYDCQSQTNQTKFVAER